MKKKVMEREKQKIRGPEKKAAWAHCLSQVIIVNHRNEDRNNQCLTFVSK